MYEFERRFYNISGLVKDKNIPKYVEILRKIEELNENQELTNEKYKYYKNKLNELMIE